MGGIFSCFTSSPQPTNANTTATRTTVSTRTSSIRTTTGAVAAIHRTSGSGSAPGPTRPPLPSVVGGGKREHTPLLEPPAAASARSSTNPGPPRHSARSPAAPSTRPTPKPRPTLSQTSSPPIAAPRPSSTSLSKTSSPSSTALSTQHNINIAADSKFAAFKCQPGEDEVSGWLCVQSKSQAPTVYFSVVHLRFQSERPCRGLPPLGRVTGQPDREELPGALYRLRNALEEWLENAASPSGSTAEDDDPEEFVAWAVPLFQKLLQFVQGEVGRRLEGGVDLDWEVKLGTSETDYKVTTQSMAAAIANARDASDLVTAFSTSTEGMDVVYNAYCMCARAAVYSHFYVPVETTMRSLGHVVPFTKTAHRQLWQPKPTIKFLSPCIVLWPPTATVEQDVLIDHGDAIVLPAPNHQRPTPAMYL